MAAAWARRKKAAPRLDAQRAGKKALREISRVGNARNIHPGRGAVERD